jgi:hypothetical protein
LLFASPLTEQALPFASHPPSPISGTVLALNKTQEAISIQSKSRKLHALKKSNFWLWQFAQYILFQVFWLPGSLLRPGSFFIF